MSARQRGERERRAAQGKGRGCRIEGRCDSTRAAAKGASGRWGPKAVGCIVAVANQKGGVAKTTTTINLAAALGRRGQRVLVVDLDPQGSLTLCCGFNPDRLSASIYEALMKGLPAEEIRLRAAFGVDLLPANIDLSMAEMELVHLVARERRLGAVLSSVRDVYDFVLLDCQPSLGLLTVNALAVADEVLIPVACEFLSQRGVDVLLKMLGKIRLRLNSRLRVIGILPTLFDSRTIHARQTLEWLADRYGARYRLFPTPIARSIRFAESARQGKPIFDVAPEIPGAHAYEEAAQHLLNERSSGRQGRMSPE
ncbi:MAG TPA: ParA family protein [Limnochordia bacterium]